MRNDGYKESQVQIDLETTPFTDEKEHPVIDNMVYQKDAVNAGDEWLFGTTRN